MGSSFHDSSFVEDDDPVGGGGLGQAVRHDEGGASAENPMDGSFERAGSGRACFGGGFVKDDDGGAEQDEPCERELLALRGGELVPAGADGGLESRRQILDPTERIDAIEGVAQLSIASGRRGKAEIGGERAGEDVDVLGPTPPSAEPRSSAARRQDGRLQPGRPGRAPDR